MEETKRYKNLLCSCNSKGMSSGPSTPPLVKQPLSLGRLSQHQIQQLLSQYGGRFSLWERFRTGFWGSPYLESCGEPFGLPDSGGPYRVVMERGRRALFLHIHQHPDYAGIVCLKPEEIRAIILDTLQASVTLSFRDNRSLSFKIPSQHRRSFCLHFRRWAQKETLWPMKLT